MGIVIGKRRENLDKIGQKTGATLKVWERNGLYIKGSPESQKRAIREIKEHVVSLAMKESIQQTSRLIVQVLNSIWFISNVKQRGDILLREPHNESDTSLCRP